VSGPWMGVTVELTGASSAFSCAASSVGQALREVIGEAAAVARSAARVRAHQAVGRMADDAEQMADFPGTSAMARAVVSGLACDTVARVSDAEDYDRRGGLLCSESWWVGWRPGSWPSSAPRRPRNPARSVIARRRGSPPETIFSGCSIAFADPRRCRLRLGRIR